VKSAWVLAAGLPNPDSYITTTATVPTYNQSNANLWTPTGQQTVKLALVGMHVVGSTAGHPEMAWATFEHVGTTPMDSHVLRMLASGDVRANYFMTGATWTAFGSNPSNTNLGVGTNQLANAAMETYAQGSNCFGCHQNINPSPRVTTEVSHIFDGLQPLF
jgi:hypothetical protein